MNRRLFLAALVSVVSAKVFPQRAAASDVIAYPDLRKVSILRVSEPFISGARIRFADNVNEGLEGNRGQIKIELDGPPHQFISFSEDFKRRKLQAAATPE